MLHLVYFSFPFYLHYDLILDYLYVSKCLDEMNSVATIVNKCMLNWFVHSVNSLVLGCTHVVL